MKFTCKRQDFNDALSLVGSVVPTRSTKPILQNIRFDGNSDKTITMSATDLEVGVKYTLVVDDISDPESVVLPAVRLTGIIREAWGDMITIEVKDNKADIITEGGKFHVLGESAEEFPTIPDMEEGSGAEVLADDLAQSISRTVFAASKEEDRYALAGVHVVMEGDRIDMVTTDTFRLAISSKPLRTRVDGIKKAIVLAKGMQELSKLVQNEEIIKIDITDTQFFAKSGRALMVSRLIEGKFPNYKKIIPEGLDKKVIVNRERLLQALRQASQLANMETRAVTLVTEGNSLIVKAATVDGSNADIRLDAVVEGGDVSVVFNYTYLTDAFKILSDEEITLQLKDRESPGRIDSKDYIYVVSEVWSQGGA